MEKEEEKNKILKKKLVVNVNDMRQMKRDMLAITAKIEDSCKECYKKIDETVKIYDTPTGKYFREKANEFILQNQTYLSKEVIPYINQIDKIIEVYETLYQEVDNIIKKR